MIIHSYSRAPSWYLGVTADQSNMSTEVPGELYLHHFTPPINLHLGLLVR